MRLFLCIRRRLKEAALHDYLPISARCRQADAAAPLPFRSLHAFAASAFSPPPLFLFSAIFSAAAFAIAD
jgi:hypothetical protein